MYIYKVVLRKQIVTLINILIYIYTYIHVYIMSYNLYFQLLDERKQIYTSPTLYLVIFSNARLLKVRH